MASAVEAASIGVRLARIAERLPGKIAVSEDRAQLTFAQLDAAANAVARRVLAVGNARGAVCLLFEGKIAAIRAILGASRCGCPYVPLDTRDPDERLRFIVQDSEPVALLTESRVLYRARALAPRNCAIIDVGDLQTGAVPLADVSPDATAYRFYTSGSTGQPKGVMQTHRNLLFFADAYSKTLCIDPADRVSLLYSLSFSAANMDIFGGMLNGATLVGYDMRRDGIPLLADWLDREQITVLHAVPTVFRELFGGLAPGRKLSHLRAIDLGGEAVFGSDVELFRQHAREGCMFVNHLAATEASVIAQHVMDHRTGAVAGILPVGRPPPGLHLAICREDGRRADSGETGQIVVSSRHVSPVYWRRPELDAAAFAADPIEPDNRLYFTGDHGRIDLEGNLHFLGRSGNRIKIRGHTVDLAEVESALAAFPGVLKAAVLALQREPTTEPDRLVAYLAVRNDAEKHPLALRRLLAATLPAYMLPTGFVFMDALPVTASGKIDRRALGAIAPTLDRDRLVEPPRDDVERAVAEIFQALLKQAPVGRGDDFFLLGGDSLSLVELQTRLLDQFGVSLSKSHEDASVAGIAIVRSRRPAAGFAESMPVLFPIREKGSAPPMFLVHGRLGQAFVSPHFLTLLGDDLPVWAFQARGLDGLHEPHATIEAMAADYVGEMRLRRPKGPYFIAALCAGTLIASVMARMLRDAGEQTLPLLLFDPPERRLRAAVTEESLLFRIKAREGEGRFLTPIDEPGYATAAVRTARAFEQAIWNHEPQAYDGPVYMLSSSQRMTGADSPYLKRIFTGTQRRFEVGTTHAEALDPRNPVFAEHLAHCLAMILGAVGQPQL